jgi:hypothetical protein
MPTKSKSRNNSRNSSKKSTASSQGAPKVKVEEDDFGVLSILMKTKPQTSKKTTPTTPRPEFLEPLSPTLPPPPPPTPWEDLGMSEPEFLAMMKRVRDQQCESMRENYINNLLADFKRPSFWLRRIEQLEKEREYFNKKRGWSAMDITAVDRIDEDIQECENELDLIYAEEERLEVEYD